MSYAVRKDGLGWRAVESAADCGVDEIWEKNQPPLVQIDFPPQSVTMRQARLALLAADLLDDVDTAIAAIPDAVQRKAALIEWEFAATVDRQSPFTQQLAAGLGLDDVDLDALFTAAAAL